MVAISSHNDDFLVIRIDYRCDLLQLQLLLRPPLHCTTIVREWSVGRSLSGLIRDHETSVVREVDVVLVVDMDCAELEKYILIVIRGQEDRQHDAYLIHFLKLNLCSEHCLTDYWQMITEE